MLKVNFDSVQFIKIACVLYLELKDGHTALHIAVTHGQALVVETLLGFGAAVQLKAGAVTYSILNVTINSIRRRCPKISTHPFHDR